jgi:DNA-binding transcriptional regulator YdaS (Cro superfamily)
VTLYLHDRGKVVGVVSKDGALCTHNMTLRDWRETGAWLAVQPSDVPDWLSGRLNAAERRCEAHEWALEAAAGGTPQPKGDADVEPAPLARCECGRASLRQPGGGPCYQCIGWAST